MAIYESISNAEKVAWFGLIGGFCVATIKVVRWLANFSEEHRLLMEHLKEVAPLVPRIITMEETTRQAKEERKEMLEELRGLRQDLTNLYTALIKNYEERG
jgi:hypothetical protein